MKIRTRNAGGVLLTLAAALAVTAAPVFAMSGTFRANTTPVQSGAAQAEYSGLSVTGTATLTLVGNKLTAVITASGLSPSLPHLMHIHGVVGAQNDCPPSSVAGADGLVDTIDGLPAYGPVLVTFSESGSTSASAAFNIADAAEADANGNLFYSRTFKIPGNVGAKLDDLHVVIHGADLDDSGEYDGAASSLGGGIFLEQEIPVSCGAIN